MRRVVDGVDPGERADRVRELRDAGHVDERPDRVRGPREGDYPCPLGEQRGEVLEIERRVVAKLGEPNDDAEVVAQLEPRRDVAVVVELRHDDLVAGLELAADRPRECEVERRHVRAERRLLRLAAQE